MQSRTKNPKTRSQIEAMSTRAFGIGLDAGDDAVQELKEGWFNAAYGVRLADGREAILKIAPVPGVEVLRYEKNIMATEIATTRLVRQNPAIPAPEIYFSDETREICDSDYFFMEKIHGNDLRVAKTYLSEDAMKAIEFQIGGIIREVNTFTGTHYGLDGNPELSGATWREAFINMFEGVLADAAEKQVVFDYTYDEFRAMVQRFAYTLDEVTTPHLVHWDAWELNFFERDGRVVGLIDFERALWGDPLIEAQFRPYSTDGVTEEMRGYGKTTFTKTEEERGNLYSLYLGVVMNTECFYRNYETDDIFNFSRQYIATAMEWLKAH